MSEPRARARKLVISARNAAWMNLPVAGRAEIRWRRSKLVTKLWDLRLLSMWPRSTGTALDIGANIGVYSSVLADRFATVHAFEPNPAVARRLAAAAAGNVTVWPLALSNTSEPKTLRVPVVGDGEVSGLGTIEPLAAGAASRESTVQAITLDSLDLGAVELMKIDVEGHELAVLDGGRRTLATPTLRAVLVEAEERHTPGTTSALVELMAGAGFDGLFAFEGGVHPVSEFDPPQHQVEAQLATPARYANMFLFLRPGDDELARLAQTAARDAHGQLRSASRSERQGR